MRVKLTPGISQQHSAEGVHDREHHDHGSQQALSEPSGLVIDFGSVQLPRDEQYQQRVGNIHGVQNEWPFFHLV